MKKKSASNILVVILLFSLFLCPASFAEERAISPEVSRYLGIGWENMRIGEYAEALEAFDEAIRLDPFLAESYVFRSLVYRELGKGDLAIEDLKIAADLGSESAQASLNELRQAAMAEVVALDNQFAYFRNATVMDTITNLVWAAEDSGRAMNWEEARDYCKNYRGGGYADWRMPTINELKTLCNKEQTTAPVTYVFATRLIKISSVILWASESDGSYAAVFNFKDCMDSSWEGKGDYIAKVIPVRNVTGNAQTSDLSSAPPPGEAESVNNEDDDYTGTPSQNQNKRSKLGKSPLFPFSMVFFYISLFVLSVLIIAFHYKGKRESKSKSTGAPAPPDYEVKGSSVQDPADEDVSESKSVLEAKARLATSSDEKKEVTAVPPSQITKTKMFDPSKVKIRR